MPRWFYILLIFAFAAPLMAAFHLPPVLLFIVAALGIVPLASLIGKSVEQVAEHTGEGIGGILFATFGNATELIIGIIALSQGLVSVVTASIIGSILGNALLVLGVSVCVGSVKHGRLEFETRPANQYASLLALCVAGLVLPTIAMRVMSSVPQAQIIAQGELLSDFIAVLLLVGYVASILFSVFHVGDKGRSDAEELDPVLGARSASAIKHLLASRHHVATSNMPGKTGVLRQIDGTVDTLRDPVSQQAEKQLSAVAQEQQKKPLLWRALLLLAIATIGVAVLSEILVSAIEPLTELLHWNPAFVGLIFVPLIGSLPEYFNTISMALDKRMGMVLAASAGSSIQIALLMTPILVLVSLLTPKRLDLVFSLIELVVLGLATFLFSEITKDGELVWLEGLLLILLYMMMGGTVFIFGS